MTNRHRTPFYRPSDWELQEAARRNCSVREFWAQIDAENQVVDEEDRRQMNGEEGDE